MFRAWSCGHNHQQDGDGRTPTCDNANWYLLEVGSDDHGYSDLAGLQTGDYTMHKRSQVDGTFSPARWGDATAGVKEVAHSDDRRLMVRCGGEWVEVP